MSAHRKYLNPAAESKSTVDPFTMIRTGSGTVYTNWRKLRPLPCALLAKTVCAKRLWTHFIHKARCVVYHAMGKPDSLFLGFSGVLPPSSRGIRDHVLISSFFDPGVPHSLLNLKRAEIVREEGIQKGSKSG